jgi:hypothetical protein
MAEQKVGSEVVVSGNYRSIDLLRVTQEDVRKIRADGITIHHPFPSEWIQNRAERVYQGLFEKVSVHINGRSAPRRRPKDPQHVESVTGSFIGYFETSQAKLTLPVNNEFDPKMLRIKWKHLELEADAEPYNFASIYYGTLGQDDLEHDSVDEGFFLIDASEGIIELDIAKRGINFTLVEKHRDEA